MQELKDIKIGQPAHRALQANGIDTFKQLCSFSEKELLALHGIDPKVISILKEALQKEGLLFKK